MSHLVRPDRPISPQAMAIHRITESMVADKPWIEEIIPHYYGSPWYVAHNASFDRRVLPEMPGEWICTMKLARRLWPGLNTAIWRCTSPASSAYVPLRGFTITAPCMTAISPPRC